MEEPRAGHPSPRTSRGAALTPAVGHDLQGQGHQVIKGGVQDNSTDVWVGHGCPRGWQNKKGGGSEVQAGTFPLGPSYPLQPLSLEAASPFGSYQCLCPHLLGRDKNLCWVGRAGVAGTGEASDGPGVDDNILGLEAQAVDGKLNYHIHGIGLILWEWYPLQEDGQK